MTGVFESISLDQVKYIGALSIMTPPVIYLNLKHFHPLQLPSFRAIITRLWPTQLILRGLQFQCFQYTRQHTNDWVGFFIMGISQGLIYNHCAQFFTRTPFFVRGLPWAGLRDIMSQGIPFSFKHTSGLTFGLISVTSTILSQPLHNKSLMKNLNGWGGFQYRLGLMMATNALNYYYLK